MTTLGSILLGAIFVIIGIIKIAKRDQDDSSLAKGIICIVAGSLLIATPVLFNTIRDSLSDAVKTLPRLE